MRYKYTKVVVIILVLLFSLLFVTGCHKTSAAVKKTPITVTVSSVESRYLSNSKNISGRVVTKNSVEIYARVKGFLKKECFTEGQYVHKGQLLFQIEKNEYKADLLTGEANLANAKAVLKNANIEYKRCKYLLDKKSISTREYNIADCEKEIAVANLEAAKANLEHARLNLSYTDIYAPFDGRIGLSGYGVGGLVGPEFPPLADINMLSPIDVEFNINESFFISLVRDITTFKREKLSSITAKKNSFIPSLILSDGTKYFENGKINFIDNNIDSSTGSILIHASFQNKKHILLPGAYVNVHIEKRVKKQYLLIPQSAIQEDQSGTFVFRVNKDNFVKKQIIEVGGSFSKKIAILSGLKENEVVVTQGIQKVNDGDFVYYIFDNDQDKIEKTRIG
jgi:membrane fusion protein, multidrug efflux system